MLNYIFKKAGISKEPTGTADLEKPTIQSTGVASKMPGDKPAGTSVAAEQATQTESKPVIHTRVSGRTWREAKAPLRTRSLGVQKSKWDKKRQQQLELKAVKAKEKELKDDKEAARRTQIEETKARKEAKEEKERYERLAEKMHQKRVERMRKREKRNKLLKDR